MVIRRRLSCPLPSARAPPPEVWGRQYSLAAGAAFPHGMTQNGADGRLQSRFGGGQET